MSFTNESGKVSIDGSREGMGSERFARGRGTVAGGESRKPKYSEGSEVSDYMYRRHNDSPVMVVKVLQGEERKISIRVECCMMTS